LKKTDNLTDICIDGKIILKWNLKEMWEGVDCTYQSGQKPVADYCEHGPYEKRRIS
jgi:hypothetical protein